MFAFVVFILSGVVLAILTLAKRFEMKGKKIILLRALSQSDEQARDIYHKSLHFYSEGKLKAIFFVKKQLPARIKIYINKGALWMKERGEERFGNIRNSRLIKRPDGISEFFKSISEVEKGAGELHDDIFVEEVEEKKEEILAYRITPVPVAGSTPKRKRAPRKPRMKKIPVVEANEY